MPEDGARARVGAIGLDIGNPIVINLHDEFSRFENLRFGSLRLLAFAAE
jgi:hypothetical protein